MRYKVIPTPEFIKNLKSLSKKYKSIKKDILDLELVELIRQIKLNNS